MQRVLKLCRGVGGGGGIVLPLDQGYGFSNSARGVLELKGWAVGIGAAGLRFDAVRSLVLGVPCGGGGGGGQGGDGVRLRLRGSLLRSCQRTGEGQELQKQAEIAL